MANEFNGGAGVCEVCGAGGLTQVLDLGAHPMCDDLVPLGSARKCAEYPIDIYFCSRCVTAHQRVQIPKAELFPPAYHYRSRFTADVLAGMAQLVQSCERRIGGADGFRGRKVLDIGCNDGSLLDIFQRKGAATIGIEPTLAHRDMRGKGHAVYPEYLSPAVAERIAREHGEFDFITFTNVFAHIENLGEALASLRRLMSEKTLLVIENHYLGRVLETNQFDTFYHEHPRTYSCTSFTEIARALDAVLLEVEFPSRYGGNIRVTLGGQRDGAVACSKLAEICAREAGFAERFDALRKNVSRWRRSKRAEIDRLVAQHGPLPAKAFPGRAAILVKLLGLTDQQIACAWEKPGSMKVGHYIPGTRIPIQSDDGLFAQKPPPPVILNLAWHIADEIRAYLAAAGCASEVVDIVEQRDFQA